MAVEIRRVYDDDGTGAVRVLVDRLWPRGVRKESLPLDDWLKDVAPSTALRKWYGHDPAKFDEFARRYRAELAEEPAASVVADLRRTSRRRHVVLLTATRDVEHSGAVVLAGVVAKSAVRARP